MVPFQLDMRRSSGLSRPYEQASNPAARVSFLSFFRADSSPATRVCRV